MNPNTGAPYLDNQIPVSPVATYILNHIPLPNGPNDQLNFNGGPDAQNTDEYLAKVDFNIGKHHLSAHYFQMNYTNPIFVPPSSNLLQLRGDAEDLVLKNISVVDIYTISPTFLLSSYFGYNSENGTTLSSAPFSMADAGREHGGAAKSRRGECSRPECHGWRRFYSAGHALWDLESRRSIAA